MARGKPSPDEQIEVLEKEQSGLDEKRAAVGAALAAAREVLGTDGPRSAANRQRVALQNRERGRQHELLEVIAKDAQDAHAAVTSCTAHLQALDGASGEISAEIEAVRDGAIEHFAHKAHAASVAAVDAQETARAAIGAAHAAWRAADGLWGQVRTSRRRLSYPDLPTGPVADLGTLSRAFVLACERPPWPGGQRPPEDQLSVTWEALEYPARFEKAAPVPS